jgi:hypothetical protein
MSIVLTTQTSPSGFRTQRLISGRFAVVALRTCEILCCAQNDEPPDYIGSFLGSDPPKAVSTTFQNHYYAKHGFGIAARKDSLSL